MILARMLIAALSSAMAAEEQGALTVDLPHRAPLSDKTKIRCETLAGTVIDADTPTAAGVKPSRAAGVKPTRITAKSVRDSWDGTIDLTVRGRTVQLYVPASLDGPTEEFQILADDVDRLSAVSTQSHPPGRSMWPTRPVLDSLFIQKKEGLGVLTRTSEFRLFQVPVVSTYYLVCK